MTTKILNEEDNEKCETVWKNIRPSYVKRIHDTYKSRQEKAFERRKENKELKNRKKEITQSRDNWKNKYVELKDNMNQREIDFRNKEKEFETKVKKLKEEEQQLEERKKALEFKDKKFKKKELSINQNIYTQKPKNHGFSLDIIQLALSIKLKTSASFRAINKIINIFLEYFQLDIKSPTHVTIANRVKKLGYFLVTKPKELSNNRIIILDETIKIGQDKLLVIFGIKEKDLSKDRALVFTDLTILYQKVLKISTGEVIGGILSNLQKEIGKIIYGVGDGGGNLKKGLRLSGIKYVVTTHVLDFAKSKYLYKAN